MYTLKNMPKVKGKKDLVNGVTNLLPLEVSWKLFTRCAKQKNIFGNIKKDWYLRQSQCPSGFNKNR